MKGNAVEGEGVLDGGVVFHQLFQHFLTLLDFFLQCLVAGLVTLQVSKDSIWDLAY